MWMMGALTILMSIVALFSFKRRPVQMRLVRLGFLVNLSFIVYLFFAIDKVNAELYKSSMDIFYHAGFYMPVISLAFLFLAQRGIKADEALVKSLDRLR
jgi:Na+-translocating ferredoxin:NAD+ oxidoreductase RnfA subunit